jgi:hypothetical protein
VASTAASVPVAADTAPADVTSGAVPTTNAKVPRTGCESAETKAYSTR